MRGMVTVKESPTLARVGRSLPPTVQDPNISDDIERLAEIVLRFLLERPIARDRHVINIDRDER